MNRAEIYDRGLEILYRPEFRLKYFPARASLRGVKRLYATTDLTEAELLRALLRDRGIESWADNAGSASLAVGIPTAAVPIGINVSDEDAPAAAEALARHFENRQSEEMEPDPEAPEPLSPEESAAFEAKIKKRSARWRFWELFIYGLPGIIVLVVMFEKPWQMALAGTAGVFSIFALLWVFDLIAENRTGPSPESGNGPAKDPSEPT